MLNKRIYREHPKHDSIIIYKHIEMYINIYKPVNISKVKKHGVWEWYDSVLYSLLWCDCLDNVIVTSQWVFTVASLSHDTFHVWGSNMKHFTGCDKASSCITKNKSEVVWYTQKKEKKKRTSISDDK